MGDENENDDLGDFEDYGEEDEGEPETLVEAAEAATPLGPDNPLGLDPRVGAKDLCYDRAKPGAKVYVVAVLAGSVDQYEELFPDAPALDEYAGNVLPRMSREDTVFACVYVKDSLTSVDTNLTAYPMPESRLTRYPAEEASMVGESEFEFARTRVPEEDGTGVWDLQFLDDEERERLAEVVEDELGTDVTRRII